MIMDAWEQAFGYWQKSNQADPRAYALYERHYSYNPRKNRKSRQFMGAGEQLVLLSSDATVLFGWKVQRYRKDGQTGIECSIFHKPRNAPGLASDLIRDAMSLAWARWPYQARMFTYINAGKVQSDNPGYCFLCAGWKRAGMSKNGLLLLEYDKHEVQP